MMMVGKRRVGRKGMEIEWPWSGRWRGEIRMIHVKLTRESAGRAIMASMWNLVSLKPVSIISQSRNARGRERIIASPFDPQGRQASISTRQLHPQNTHIKCRNETPQIP